MRRRQRTTRRLRPSASGARRHIALSACAAGLWLAVAAPGQARAEEPADVVATRPDTAPEAPPAAPTQAPSPYSGDFRTRSTLSGDWGGLRNDLAAKGVTLDASVTQTGLSVVDGGKNSDWEYAGRTQLTATFDTGKMGLWPGGFLTVEAEGNWGNGGNLNTGALLPVNTNAVFPVQPPGGGALTAVQYLQFLSPYWGVLLGKLDVTAADDNEFAHGKGDMQFMNVALELNPLTLVATPYTPLGAGVIVLPDKNPADGHIEALIYTASGKANSAGFDKIRSDDLSFYLEGRMRTNFFDMTGHLFLAGIYSNKTHASIDQRLSLDPSVQQLATKSNTWLVFGNFDQYFYEPAKGKGVGVFGRFGVSDGNPNFMNYFGSLGIGGKGIVPGRPGDSFGVGWYYLAINNPTLSTPVGDVRFLRDEQGLEAYYSIEVTPWAYLSPDLQVVRGAQARTLTLPPRNIGAAVVVGLRLGLKL